MVVIICCTLVAAIFRYGSVVWYSQEEDVFRDQFSDSGNSGKSENQVIFEGIITGEPDRRENSTRLVVGVEAVQGAEGKMESVSREQVRVLITSERYSAWEYGDKIKISGKLEKPENFTSSTGREFDYVSYLAKDNIAYQMLYPKLTLLAHSQAGFISQKLFEIKHAFTRGIESVIGEPESALLAGLLLGAKHSLGKDILEDFRRAGVIHIVVLSGYNITIVSDFIMRLLGFLPRAFGFTLGGLGIVMFALMTGGAASTVRASTMAFLVLVAKATGRNYMASRALFVTAFGMVMWNPHILLSDPSFQLSFMATFGLIYVSPIVEEKFSPLLSRFIPEKFHIRELALSTLSTQIFLLPLLLYQTGMFSLVALPANLLILGAIPFTMLMGFVTGVLSFISTTLALPFAFVANFLLAYIIAAAKFFSRLPFSVFTLNSFPFWLVVVIYAFYFRVLYKFHKNPARIIKEII